MQILEVSLFIPTIIIEASAHFCTWINTCAHTVIYVCVHICIKHTLTIQSQLPMKIGAYTALTVLLYNKLLLTNNNINAYCELSPAVNMLPYTHAHKQKIGTVNPQQVVHTWKSIARWISNVELDNSRNCGIHPDALCHQFLIAPNNTKHKHQRQQMTVLELQCYFLWSLVARSISAGHKQLYFHQVASCTSYEAR